jgi:hypothetical protein
MRILLAVSTLVSLCVLIGMNAHQSSCSTCNGNTLEVVNLNASGIGTFGGSVSANDGLSVQAPGLTDTSLDTVLKRIHWGGSAVTASDFAVSSGWGTGTSCPSKCVVNDNPNDSSGVVTITSGSGSITADPRVTLTFADGTGGNNVLCSAVRADVVSDSVSWRVSTIGTTSVTWTFEGTPAVNTNYGLLWHCDFH